MAGLQYLGLAVLRYRGVSTPRALCDQALFPRLWSWQTVYVDEEFLDGFKMVGNRDLTVYPVVKSIGDLRGHSPRQRNPLTLEEVMDLVVRRGYKWPYVEEVLRFVDEDTVWIGGVNDVFVLPLMNEGCPQRLLRISREQSGPTIDPHTLIRTLRDDQFVLLLNPVPGIEHP